MTWRVPVDSADARELREIAEAAEHHGATADPAAPRARPHDTACVDGWLGEDDEGRPIPCPRCHPALRLGGR